MTISSEENRAAYFGDGVLTAFSYSYRADNDSDIHVFLGTIEQVSGYSLVRESDGVGGEVTFDVAPGESVAVDILRKVPLTQEVDYSPYDAFPAETHERALDKLTMAVQQITNTSEGIIRTPETEGGAANTVVPPIPDRAEKYMFFDEDGNVTAVEAELAAPAVFRVDIQNGTGGEDSRSLMLSETISGGANYPKIGFRNINKANGPVQLDEQGNIPMDLINIVGLQTRGSFRGDDLCDKEGDDLGQCITPDTRNPSQRFVDLESSFSNGDVFIVTMGESETSGTMELFPHTGSQTMEILNVNARDGLLFLEDVNDPDTGDQLIWRGWYLIQKLVETGDASSVSYDPSGNTYIQGNNVQVALDQTDNHFVDQNNWYLTQRTSTREAIVRSDADDILAGGFYRFPQGSANLPTNHEYYMTQVQGDGANLVQTATSRDDGGIWGRGQKDGSWSAWKQAGGDIPAGTVMLFYQATAPAGWTKIGSLDDVMVRVVSGDGGGSGGSDSPILNDKVPSHTHLTNSAGLHKHMPDNTSDFWGTGGGSYSLPGGSGVQQTNGTSTTGAHTHQVEANAGAANWTPKYINCILCSKN